MEQDRGGDLGLGETGPAPEEDAGGHPRGGRLRTTTAGGGGRTLATPFCLWLAALELTRTQLAAGQLVEACR